MDKTLSDLHYIADLMKKRSGVVFTPEKFYVIITKLQPLLEKYNLATLDDLISAVKMDNNEQMVTDIVDNLTINETSFFRDRYPFEIVNNDVINDFKQKSSSDGTLNILCAACSTGQEPYSLAMSLFENNNYKNNFKITAIDISHQAIEKAKSGIYNQFEVQRGVPITLLIKYFNQIDKAWQIKDEIKKYISFSQYNLTNDLEKFGKFDVIFLRNILIYFDSFQKRKVLTNIMNVLNPKGYLFLGSTEILNDFEDQLIKIKDRSGVFKKI